MGGGGASFDGSCGCCDGKCVALCSVDEADHFDI